MFEEKGLIDKANPTLKQKSLLLEYNIPIGHLSFEYIGTCKDVKELERIVRILRSNEEGYYADLEIKAEERLRLLNPNSRQLRSDEPVLTGESLNKEEWQKLANDLSNWKKEVSERDISLAEENNNTMEAMSVSLPVRQSLLVKSTPQNQKSSGNVVRTKRGMSDYVAWEMYNEHSELLKLDLEEERQEREKEKKWKERKREELREREREEIRKEKRLIETKRLNALIKEAVNLPDIERQILAEQEKARGNEYYRVKEFPEAIEYYTASIHIWATPKAYNNRAACYLQQCRYSNALEDANMTLAMEPENIKALFRRGIALQHKNEFRQALADMNAILRQQPKHLLAQHISKELHEQILTLPRAIRFMRDEGFNKPKKVVDSKGGATKARSGCRTYEINEWGLPKVMCECSGSPKFLQFAPRKTHLPQFITQLPSTSTSTCTSTTSNLRIVEVTDDHDNTPKPSTKLEIVEFEKSETSEDFFIQKKCAVVSERTLLKPFSVGNENMCIADDNKSCTLSLYEPATTSSSAESTDYITADEDFELNPLLDDASDRAEV